MKNIALVLIMILAILATTKFFAYIVKFHESQQLAQTINQPVVVEEASHELNEEEIKRQAHIEAEREAERAKTFYMLCLDIHEKSIMEASNVENRAEADRIISNAHDKIRKLEKEYGMKYFDTEDEETKQMRKFAKILKEELKN